MIPATWAVVGASPFGSLLRRRAVSGAIRTVARAIARRRDNGLSPTSTMRTSPASLTWLSSSPMPRSILTTRRRRDPVGGAGLQPDPGAQIVLPHLRTGCLEAFAPLGLRELQRFRERGPPVP